MYASTPKVYTKTLMNVVLPPAPETALFYPLLKHVLGSTENLLVRAVSTGLNMLRSEGLF